MQLNRHGYVFKKPITSHLIRAFDFCGSKLFRYSQLTSLNPKRIAVLRLDHIGDAVMADAFITQLSTQYPQSEIVLLASAAGSKVFGNRTIKSGGPIREVIALQVAWFQSRRNIGAVWISFLRLIKTLRSIRADYVIDLRGDVRHILAARIASRSAYIQSFGITGGKFLLNECHTPDLTAHAVMRNMTFLNRPVNSKNIHLSDRLASQPLPPDTVVFQPHQTYVAIHPSAGTAAKQWSSEYWVELVRTILKYPQYKIIWIGDSSCEHIYQQIAKSVESCFFEKSTNLINRIPLESLGSLLASCQVLVSPDSGPVHIAAARHVPVVVLFSGTSQPHEWVPWECRSQMISKPVECAPCYRTICNQDRHHCMLDISPAEVFDAIEDVTMSQESI